MFEIYEKGECTSIIKCNICGTRSDLGEGFEKLAKTTTGQIFYAVCRCGSIYHKSVTKS